MPNSLPIIDVDVLITVECLEHHLPQKLAGLCVFPDQLTLGALSCQAGCDSAILQQR